MDHAGSSSSFDMDGAGFFPPFFFFPRRSSSNPFSWPVIDPDTLFPLMLLFFFSSKGLLFPVGPFHQRRSIRAHSATLFFFPFLRVSAPIKRILLPVSRCPPPFATRPIFTAFPRRDLTLSSSWSRVSKEVASACYLRRELFFLERNTPPLSSSFPVGDPTSPLRESVSFPLFFFPPNLSPFFPDREPRRFFYDLLKVDKSGGFFPPRGPLPQSSVPSRNGFFMAASAASFLHTPFSLYGETRMRSSFPHENGRCPSPLSQGSVERVPYCPL